MVNPDEDDWLPTGWSVEVKLRKSGKKDKCYIAPSGEPIFHSKSEVSCYLDAEQTTCADSERKKNYKTKLSTSIAVVEKASAEGLPPGWIKEIKVRKRARETRRDPYYTDPVSGYVFRSMKDVSRYLDTGEIGRLAFKPRERGSNDLQSECDKVPALSVAKEEGQVSTGTRSEAVMDQSLKSNGIGQGMHIPKCFSLGEEKLSERSSDQGTEPNSPSLPEVKDSDQIEGKVEFSGCNSDLGPADEALTEKKPSKDTSDMVVKPIIKSKRRIQSNFPLRASKRLAGVELAPIEEQKINNRICKITVRSSGKHTQLQAESNSKSAEGSLESDKLKKLYGDTENFKKYVGLEEIDNKVMENQASIPDLNLVNQPHVQHVDTAKVENTIDATQGESPLVSSFGDWCTDPCFEFAIKTLTGTIDLDIHDYYNNQSNPLQGNNSALIPNLGLDNPFNNNIGSHQLDTGNKCHKPTFGVTVHESIQNSVSVEGPEWIKPIELRKEASAISEASNPAASRAIIGVATDQSLESNGIILDTRILKSSCVGDAGALINKEPSEDTGHVVARHGKSKGKRKEPNLPLRSSNRVAGVKLDPTPDLKTISQSRKKTTSSKSPIKSQIYNCRNPSGDLVNSDIHNGDAETKNMLAKNQPPAGVETENDTNTNVNPGESSTGLPFWNSWSDPCMEFAVKTLTGEIDLDIHDYFDRQMNSSHGDSNNSGSHTDLWTPQFDTANNPTVQLLGQNSLDDSGENYRAAKPR